MHVSPTVPGLPAWWPPEQQFAWMAVQLRRSRIGSVSVVHAHGDYPSAWAALCLARRLNCPAVLTVHGGMSGWFVHRALSRWILPRLDHVIAVSADIAGQLRRLGVSEKRLSIISSGIHTNRYSPLGIEERARLRASLGVPTEGQCIIAVGRLHPVKGFRYLLEAAPMLLRRFPRLRILVVGDGPEEARLRQLAAPFPEVAFLGSQSGERVADLLRAADLFVLPSVVLNGQSEGTPTSIMEAMAAGLAVVATRTGGIPQLVEEGRNGLLVPARDTNALGEALMRILDDPGRRAEMGNANREKVRDRDWNIIAQRVTEVYRQAGTPFGAGRK